MAETQNKVGMDNSCYRAVDCAHDYEGKMGVIRMDIEQTRADMGDTMDAIAKKISPEHLRVQFREQISELGIRAQRKVEAAGDALSDRMKRHPISMGLLFMGIAWLMICFSKRGRH
jgi:hypothetical protein